MREVLSLPAGAFMDASDRLLALPSFRRALEFLRVPALRCRQRCLFLAKEAGVFDLFSGRESGEVRQPHVDTSLLLALGKWSWLPLTGEGDIPLAGRGTPDADGLGLPF